MLVPGYVVSKSSNYQHVDVDYLVTKTPIGDYRIDAVSEVRITPIKTYTLMELINKINEQHNVQFIILHEDKEVDIKCYIETYKLLEAL